MKALIISFFLASFLFIGCSDKHADHHDQGDLTEKIYWGLTNAIVEDGFTPPVAGRIYSYCFLAYYESLIAGNEEIYSLVEGLNGFDWKLPHADADKYDAEVAAIHASLEIAKLLVYKDYLLPEPTDLISESRRLDNPYTIQIADEIVSKIADWMRKDNYNETRNLPLYKIPDGWGTWEPTPPTYGTAIEPYWNSIRPFVIDSIEAFATYFDLNYDTLKNSDFYEGAMTVYDAVDTIDDAGVRKAQYWDCNPMVMQTSGHMMSVKKQMSPGGHWLGIANTAINLQENISLVEKARIFAITAITISDAFIVCWDEKYATNLIRPETYINQYIDPSWKPILQTPLFPEYTSGHSVVSGSASYVLTNLLGDNIAYVDSVNFSFGLPPRSFRSFNEAAEEAAMSRLLGGIHYMPAIENGLTQGRNIGKSVLEHVRPYIFEDSE